MTQNSSLTPGLAKSRRAAASRTGHLRLSDGYLDTNVLLLQFLLNQDDLRCQGLDIFVLCIRMALLDVPLCVLCRCVRELLLKPENPASALPL